MPAVERTFTAQDQVSVRKRDAQSIFRVTLTADYDYAELDISGASEISLDSLGSISADTIKAYFASANTAAVRGVPGGGAVATGSITYGVPATADTVIVNGNTFTKVAAAPGAGEFTSISELEALVEAVALIHSSQDGTTITIDADAGGTAGNAITLALGGGNTGTMAISGATLTGGTDTDEWGSNYLNDAGVNPFAAANDKIVGLNVVGMNRLRIVRSGIADGDITFAVGIRN